MPFEFECTSCHRKYRVKDELAGKEVKCQCGTRIKVPLKSVSVGAPLSGIKKSPPQPVVPKQATAHSSSPAAAKPQRLVPPPDEDDLTIAPVAGAAATGNETEVCPDCGTVLRKGMVVCANCGYDARYRGQRHSIGVGDAAHEKARKAIFGVTLSLLRGSALSLVVRSSGPHCGSSWRPLHGESLAGWRAGWAPWRARGWP